MRSNTDRHCRPGPLGLPAHQQHPYPGPDRRARKGFTGVDVSARLAAAGYPLQHECLAARMAKSFRPPATARASTWPRNSLRRFTTASSSSNLCSRKSVPGRPPPAAGYNYFTANFTANDGYGAGLAAVRSTVWPFNGQVSVPRNFFSNTESPDPVPDRNGVGYPISIHAKRHFRHDCHFHQFPRPPARARSAPALCVCRGGRAPPRPELAARPPPQPPRPRAMCGPRSAAPSRASWGPPPHADRSLSPAAPPRGRPPNRAAPLLQRHDGERRSSA